MLYYKWFLLNSHICINEMWEISDVRAFWGQCDDQKQKTLHGNFLACISSLGFHFSKLRLKKTTQNQNKTPWIFQTQQENYAYELRAVMITNMASLSQKNMTVWRREVIPPKARRLLFHHWMVILLNAYR